MIASLSNINFSISSRFSSRLKSRWQEFKLIQQAAEMSTCNLTLLSTWQESRLRKVLITTSSSKLTTGWVMASQEVRILLI